MGILNRSSLSSWLFRLHLVEFWTYERDTISPALQQWWQFLGRYWLAASGRSMMLAVPWRLRHPPVGHCDTTTRTIRHCNDSPHKRFHFETIRPHRGRIVRPQPNRSIRPLTSGSKCWLWQSDPRTIRPIFCFGRRVRGQFGRRHTDGAVKKRRCATREDFTHA